MLLDTIVGIRLVLFGDEREIASIVIELWQK